MDLAGRPRDLEHLAIDLRALGEADDVPNTVVNTTVILQVHERESGKAVSFRIAFESL